MGVDQVIVKRLQEFGYSQAQANIFLFLKKPHRNAEDAYFFKTPQDFVTICETLRDFEDTDLINKIHNDVFNSNLREFMIKNDERYRDDDPFQYPALKEFFKDLARSIYDVELEPDTVMGDIPVTKEIFFEGLKKLQGEDHFNRQTDVVGDVVADYLMQTVVGKAKSEGRPVNPLEIEQFLNELSERKIEVYAYAVRNKFLWQNKVNFNGKEYDIPEDEKRLAAEVIEKFFKLKIKEKEKAEFGFDDIDKVIKDLENTQLDDTKRVEALEKFMRNMADYFFENGLNDEQKLQFAIYFFDKLQAASISYNFPLFDYIRNPEKYGLPIDKQFREKEAKAKTKTKTYDLTLEEKDINEKYNKFYLATLFGVNVFKEDGDEFYTYFKKLTDLGIDFEKLSKTELLNLCQCLILAEGHINSIEPVYFGNSDVMEIRGHWKTQIADYTRLFELPFMKKMSEAQHSLDSQSLKDLMEKTQEYLSRLDVQRRSYWAMETQIYGEDLVSLIIGKDLREECQKILREDMYDNELLDLVDFLEAFYPNGPQKNSFVKEINKKYLNSAEISLDDKITYLLKNFEKIGVEGFTTIAEQITDIEDFRKFKQRVGKHFEAYLSGSETTTLIALGDFISSFFVKYEPVFRTALNDESTIREVSTEMAKRWFESMYDPNISIVAGEVVYDKDQKKFAVEKRSRERFRSVHDYFQALRSLSSVQRAVIVLKLLVEAGGGLTSPKNREEVAGSLVRALNLNEGFLKSVVVAAVKESDAKLVAFPVAQVLGPLLFRAFDEQKIGVGDVLDVPIETELEFSETTETWERVVKTRVKDAVPAEDIPAILSSDTRSLKVFGLEYAPQSLIYRIAQESDEQYEVFTQKLREIFVKAEAPEESEDIEETDIDLHTEALIRAVEISGALGVRALQQAPQFEELPPPLERRFAQSLDSNKGMEKLRFWINLDKLASENPEIEEFVHKIKLGDYSGGGSLQTTYKATFYPENGEPQEVVLRMKNPNVELFIDEVYKSAMKTLEAVVNESTDPSILRYAKTGMMLLDLSREWCKADINDTNYVASDDQFRITIDGFNKREGGGKFYASQKILTHPKLKVETLGFGTTANQYLADKNIDLAKKQEIIRLLSGFYLHQLRESAYIDREGRQMFILHSDPHMGNFLIDEDKGIGVIDRDYYLHLSKADVDVLNKLIYGQSAREFAQVFIDRLLDINKVIGLQKQIQKGKIMGKLGMQIATGETDRMMLLRALMLEFTQAGMVVPIELRIAIKNIEGFKRLNKKFGLEFK